jgi:hypothetical protein
MSSVLSKENDINGPIRARSDLVEMIRTSPENTEAIVAIIQNELKDLQKSEDLAEVEVALERVATDSSVDEKARDNVLYWLTKTSPDARQTIIVMTIEELLRLPETRDTMLEVLGRISTEENVEMVMEWVDRNILTLNQAVFVLLFPDSSAALV